MKSGRAPGGFSAPASWAEERAAFRFARHGGYSGYHGLVSAT